MNKERRREVYQFIKKHRALSGATGIVLAILGVYAAGQHELSSALAGFEAKPKPAQTDILNAPLKDVVVIPMIEKDGIRISGVQERIDSSNIVDVARGPFTNTLGLGTEAFIAEPGGLLVGPDFGSKSAKNPSGENPAGWDAMYGSEGSIEPFSPVSQEVLRFNGPAFQNLPEGGFVFVSAGQMTAKIGDATFEFKAQPGTNYFLVVRGLYPDGKQDSDLNQTIELTNYKPGHALVNMYNDTAFISEKQFKQMARTSHSGDTNCGDGGCSKLVAVFFDINTKALSVVTQTQDRFGNPSQGWQLALRNWDSSD